MNIKKSKTIEIQETNRDSSHSILTCYQSLLHPVLEQIVQMKELITTTHIFCMKVSVVLFDQFVKLISRNELYYMCEDIFADIHNSTVLTAKLPNPFQIKKSRNVCN